MDIVVKKNAYLVYTKVHVNPSLFQCGCGDHTNHRRERKPGNEVKK
jgi:hypothetical protein